MQMAVAEKELIAAKPYFEYLSPNWPYLARGRIGIWLKNLFIAKMAVREAQALRNGKRTADDVTGRIIGNLAIRQITAPARNQIIKTHQHVPHVPKKDKDRVNGLGGRYWIYRPGRHRMTIVFHDANRAGPHLDVHIGRFSMIRRVKPEIYDQLKYNSSGKLTQASVSLLMDFLREEVNNGSRIPQNLDHTVSNAKSEWVDGDHYGVNYGEGPTRQVILSEKVDVYKASDGGPIEVYIPSINPHRGTYIYKLYEGDESTAPILIWGSMKAQPPKLEDRLHLKLGDPQIIVSDEHDYDVQTSTAKYDGSSAYIVITNKGAHAWSPRTSKLTGDQIEYTFKIPGLAQTRSDKTVVGMGELVFKDRLKPGRYAKQATGSGILNSNSVVPRRYRPEVRMYRVDRVGRSRTVDLPFFENRALQLEVAKLNPEVLKVVELMTPVEAIARGFEGVVVGNAHDSVNTFTKTKWWLDPHDWSVDLVDLREGPRGGIAGVVHFTSLESGKKYKLGPGQLGNHAVNRELMANPSKYEGRVAKVVSRHGHEGRAARFVDWHDDKGTA